MTTRISLADTVKATVISIILAFVVVMPFVLWSLDTMFHRLNAAISIKDAETEAAFREVSGKINQILKKRGKTE